jgi:hypothetical protein
MTYAPAPREENDPPMIRRHAIPRSRERVVS